MGFIALGLGRVRGQELNGRLAYQPLVHDNARARRQLGQLPRGKGWRSRVLGEDSSVVHLLVEIAIHVGPAGNGDGRGHEGHAEMERANHGTRKAMSRLFLE